jgi:hypothetical protein
MCGHDTYDLPLRYDHIPVGERRKVREQYIKLQRNRCLWCNERLDLEPPRKLTDMPINWDLFGGHKEAFLKHPVHLQHCHTTGMTEGAVHAYCNAVMWQYHGR